MQHRHTVGLTLAIVLALGTSSAFAMSDGDKEAIRALANDAAKDFDHGDYASARDKFQRAYAIAKVPRLALRAAQADVKLGQLVAAYELYRQAIGLERNDLWVGKSQEQAQAEAQRELDVLQARLPRLTIQVQGVNASEVAVTIDGQAVPAPLLGVERFVDPGKRNVSGKFGEQKSDQVVTLAEGEKKVLVLKFTPALAMGLAVPGNGIVSAHAGAAGASKPSNTPGQPDSSASTAPSASPRRASNAARTLAWVSLGMGAGGVVVGTLAGIIVASKYSDLNKSCPDRQCDPSHQTKVNNYEHWRTVSTTGFIVGGVGAAAGVTLLLTSPKRENLSSVTLWMGPASVGVEGAF